MLLVLAWSRLGRDLTSATATPFLRRRYITPLILNRR